MNRIKPGFPLFTCVVILAGMAALASMIVIAITLDLKEDRRQRQGISHNADSGYGSEAPATLPINPPLEK